VALTSGLAVLGLTLGHQRYYLAQEARTPRALVVFADPECTRPVGALPQARLDGARLGMGRFTGFRASRSAYTPVIRWASVRPLAGGPQAGELYLAPEVRYSKALGTARVQDDGERLGFGVLAALSVALAVFLLLSADTFANCGRCLAALALLRFASLFWGFAVFGYYTVHATDETHYLRVARKLLDWGLSHKEYCTTLGNSLLYLPGLPCFGHGTEFEFVRAWAVPYYGVFSVGVVWLVAWLFRQFGENARLAWLAGLGVVLYPWLTKLHHKGDALFTYLGLQSGFPVEANTVGFYYFSDFAGYNIMSDMPALFFGLLGLALLRLRLPAPVPATGLAAATPAPGPAADPGLFLPGFALGFSCLTRIAGVYFLVPAALIWLEGTRRWSWRAALTLGFGFGLALSPQLVWNAAIFGGPLTFGYQFRPRDFQGFEWSQFRSGLLVLGAAHQQLLALFGLTLFELRRDRRSLTAFLALLAWPTFVFYCGYHAVGMNPVRFAVLPLVVMMSVTVYACCCQPGRSRAWHWGRAVVVLLPFLLVPGQPWAAYLVRVPPLIVRGAFLGLALVAVWWCRDRRMAVCAVVLAVARPEITFAYATCACAVAAWGWGVALFRQPGSLPWRAAELARSWCWALHVPVGRG
jgi:hypothetical protein